MRPPVAGSPRLAVALVAGAAWACSSGAGEPPAVPEDLAGVSIDGERVGALPAETQD